MRIESIIHEQTEVRVLLQIVTVGQTVFQPRRRGDTGDTAKLLVLALVVSFVQLHLVLLHPSHDIDDR